VGEFEVKALMESSKSEAEWNRNCDEVKRRCNGYPKFWYPLVVQSGMASRVAASFGKSAEIQITGLDAFRAAHGV